MAWVCQRCEAKIYEPRDISVRFVFQWKYKKKTNDVTMDLKNLKEVKRHAVLTHLHCNHNEVPGFKERIKTVLKMPLDWEHPLIF